MANVATLSTPAPQLTSAHRCLIACIQDMCIDVSLRRADLYATCDYSGHVHALDVRVVPNDSGHYAVWKRHVRLPGPGHQYRNPNTALAELTAALEHLESLLPPAGGAA